MNLFFKLFKAKLVNKAESKKEEEKFINGTFKLTNFEGITISES